MITEATKVCIVVMTVLEVIVIAAVALRSYYCLKSTENPARYGRLGHSNRTDECVTSTSNYLLIDL
jgi:hypothetical protein